MIEFWPIAFVAVVLLGIAVYVIFRAEIEGRSRLADEPTENGPFFR